MPIYLPTPPSNDKEIISSRLSKFFSNQESTKMILGDSKPENLSIVQPHQIFKVKLDGLDMNNILSIAKPYSWRYLIFDGEEPVAESELTMGDDTPNNRKFCSVAKTRFSENTVEALRYAEKDKRVQTSDYEFRILKITSIYVMALWLHGKENIFIPLEDIAGKFKQNNLYSELEFIKILQQIIIEMRKVSKI